MAKLINFVNRDCPIVVDLHMWWHENMIFEHTDGCYIIPKDALLEGL